MSERTAYTKSYLSLLETGKRQVRPEHVSAYELALGMDVGRLVHSVSKPSKLDAATLEDLGAILSATRRLEDSTGARTVLPVVHGIISMADVFAEESEAALPFASEVAQYLGWLQIAAISHREAKKSLDKAITLAEQAGDPNRLGQGFSFKAYSAIERGKTQEAADLTDATLRLEGIYPLQRVYDLFQRARIHAASNERHEATQTLIRADKAEEFTRDITAPDSGYWYGPGVWGLERGRVLAILGDHVEAVRSIEAGLAALSPELREAEWATQWVALTLGGDLPH